MLKHISRFMLPLALLLIIISGVQAQTPTLSISTTDVTFRNAPVIVAPNLTISGVENGELDGATILLGNGFVAAEDRLQISGVTTGSAGTIQFTYNATTGILALTGTDTVANYQAVLRQIQYQNVSATPTTGQRTVTFSMGVKIPNPQNDHYYEFVKFPSNTTPLTWQQAKLAAEAKTHFGLKGYLATVTTEQENAFIQAKLEGYGWIGGSDDPGTTGQPAHHWYWVTGPEAGTLICIASDTPGTCQPATPTTYVNWHADEPNNCCQGEAFLHYWQGEKWNDYAPNNPNIQGYVVEYGESAGDPIVFLNDDVNVNVVNLPAIPSNLLINGSFELQDDIDPLQPDIWNIVSVTQDVRSCGHSNAAEGQCMFLFVSSEIENTRIQQAVNVEQFALGAGTVMTLSYKARPRPDSVPDVRVRMIVEYTDLSVDTARSVVRTAGSSIAFQNHSVSITAAKPIRVVRIQLTNFSPVGRVFLDDFVLSADDSVIGTRLIPLPEAP